MASRGPWGSALRGKWNRAFVGNGTPGGDHAKEFSKVLWRRFRTQFERTLSNTIIYIMFKLVLKLNDFRK